MEDKKIVDLYWARSQRAIEETSKKFGHYLKSVSFNILRNNEDASECVNDTYLKAWNSMPNARPYYLKGFLSKITRNISLDLYKKNNALKRGKGEVEITIDELSEIISSGNNIDEKIDEMYILDIINKFLDNLGREKRKIFLMRYFYINSIEEISKNLNMSKNSITTILFRLRNDLKKELEKGGISVWREKIF